MHEIAVGPLNAGLGTPSAPDPSLHPEVLFASGPAAGVAIASFAAAIRWFTFGTVAVDQAGPLKIEVIDAAGATLFALPLAPRAAAHR